MAAEHHVNLLNATLINGLIVAIVVLIHHEVLIHLSGILSRMRQSHHRQPRSARGDPEAFGGGRRWLAYLRPPQ